ncbi:hypothetical protein, partial [Klebsiella pneumoniae]|uniref:hypothetical protein n=1 Tax=Klebsiella pneumoniae TaxID=573 RepID=UPI001C6F6A23
GTQNDVLVFFIVFVISGTALGTGRESIKRAAGGLTVQIHSFHRLSKCDLWRMPNEMGDGSRK